MIDLLVSTETGKSISLGGLGVIYKEMPEETDGRLAVVENPTEPGRVVRPYTTRKKMKFLIFWKAKSD